MSVRLSREVRLPAKVFGLLLAALALASQLALGAVVLPDDAFANRHSVSELDALGIICRAGAPVDPGRGHAPSHRRHAPDCAICPLCVALALPGVILAPCPMVPARSPVLAFRMTDRPPGRGPPPATARVGAPRAPPVTG